MAAETHDGNLLDLVYERLIEHRKHLDSLFYGRNAALRKKNTFAML